MTFDFRLKVFYTVASKRSYTKAANELFISQPAVSKHIHELELQLQTRLFNRNGNTISLTPSGDILLRYAEQIFKLYAQLENELAAMNDFSGGALRLGASTTVAQYVLPRILALFRKAHPSVEVTLVNGNSEEIEQLILQEKIDLALVEGLSNLPQIHYEVFVKDELVLVVRSGNKFLKGEIKASQLVGIPLVLREQGSGTLEVIYKTLSDIGINPKELSVEIFLDSTESIKEYLLYSDCAAFLSIHSITKELGQNQLAILDISGMEISRTFQFIQRQGDSLKLCEVFKRFCFNHYNNKL